MAGYENTELWKLFEQKAEAEGRSRELISAVGKVCAKGAELSRTVIAFFPTFTLHDETHLRNVSDWMLRLLGDYRNQLTVKETAYLLMSAWCHDIGMTVSAEEKRQLLKAKPTRYWNQYFDRHFSAKQAFETTGSISEETLRDYVRMFHADRAGEKLRSMEWPKVLVTECGIVLEDLIALCQSHGQELQDIYPGDASFRRCAALLRLSDLLDYDASRAPEELFHFLGLDAPGNAEQRISRVEWDKNRSGGFQKLSNGEIHYYVSCDSLQLEKEIQGYLNYVQDELRRCNDYLPVDGDLWKDFTFPNDIKVVIQQNGYKSGEFHITMDQDRVLELLTGRNVYRDASVFVRELLQNSIDAVLTRKAADTDFSYRFDERGRLEPNETAGKIRIDTWKEDGYDWFRIEDNGIGMTEHIITDYFLKVGRSYYNSEEFKKELYHRGRYTPISRFGIGILSCFMADPENTVLEVSTRRYGTSGEPAIRLDVDGLHGYYYLITEEKRGCSVRSLHHPKGEGEDDPFRDEPGTTICVRTTLRHLGKYQSFREILDRYILCPEVVIEHWAWNEDGTPDRKTYLTQQEMVKMIHEKSPDGPSKPPKEHCYPFPDELFEELKKETPDYIWEQCPELVFQFYPLDWYDDENGNLNGAAVCASVRLPAQIKPFLFDGEEVRAELEGGLDFIVSSDERPRLNLHGVVPGRPGEKLAEMMKKTKELYQEVNQKYMVFCRDYPVLKDDNRWIAKMEKTLEISRAQFEKTYLEWKEKEKDADALLKQYGEVLGHCERLVRKRNISITEFFGQCVKKDTMLRLFAPSPETSRYRTRTEINTLSSCNGISLSFSPFDRERFGLKGSNQPQCCFMLQLLSGAYRPELSLSREKVDSVSPELYYSLEHLKNKLPLLGWMERTESKPALFLVPERDYLKMIERHPSWENGISFPRKDWGYISLDELRKRVQSNHETIHIRDNWSRNVEPLPLVFLKKQFKVVFDYKTGDYHISAGKTDCETLDFPPMMFLQPLEPCQALGCVHYPYMYYNSYNPEHPFSRWLIQNRAAMEKERRSAPILRRLIEEMLTEETKTGVVKAINAALNELARLPKNPFKVSQDLYVTVKD